MLCQGPRDATRTRANPYTVTLVTGVVEHSDDIDAADRGACRRLDARPDAGCRPCSAAPGNLRAALGRRHPAAVVIDEAVELAKELSTDDSPSFVNGVLGAILAAEVPTA